jgi:hypothetical protein
MWLYVGAKAILATSSSKKPDADGSRARSMLLCFCLYYDS